MLPVLRGGVPETLSGKLASEEVSVSEPTVSTTGIFRGRPRPRLTGASVGVVVNAGGGVLLMSSYSDIEAGILRGRPRVRAGVEVVLLNGAARSGDLPLLRGARGAAFFGGATARFLAGATFLTTFVTARVLRGPIAVVLRFGVVADFFGTDFFVDGFVVVFFVGLRMSSVPLLG